MLQNIIAVSFLLFTHVGILQAEILQIEGTAESKNITALISFTIEARKKPLNFKMVKLEGHENKNNQQSIAPYVLHPYPSPSETLSYEDENKNQWFALKYGKGFNKIKIDLELKLSLKSNFWESDYYDPFPLNLLMLDGETAFLTTSENWAGKSYVLFQKFNEAIIKDSLYSFDCVLKLLYWAHGNIKVTRGIQNSSLIQILKSGEADPLGKLRFLVEAMRSIGIPARYVRGISLNQQLNLMPGSDNYIVEFPSSDYQWMEFYLPSVGWLPVDPMAAAFALTPNYVKIVTSDMPNKKFYEIIDSNGKEVESEFRIFADMNNRQHFLDVVSTSIKGNQILVMPPLPDVFSLSRLAYLDKLTLADDIPFLQTKMNKIELIPPSLSLADSFNGIPIQASLDQIYGQAFESFYKTTPNKISIPLYRFNNDPTAKLWIELLTDSEGKPDKVISRSKKRSAYKLPRNDNAFVWTSFNFSRSQQQQLQAGKYWIVLRNSGNEIVYWYAIFGNVFQNTLDTRHLPKDFYQWNHVNHFDLCFRVNG